MLRAQSVEGQLEGTIPSTSDGQSEDSSALINAEDINVSVMCGMGNRGGEAEGQESMSNNGGGMQGGMWQRGNNNSDMSSSDESAADAESSASKTVSGSVSTVNTSSGLNASVGYLTTADTDETDVLNSLKSVESSTENENGEQAVQNEESGDLGGGTPPDMNQDSGSGTQDGSDMPEMPSMPSGNASADGAETSNNAENVSASSLNETYVFLAVSAFLLLLGLLIAYKFKRY